MGRRNRESLVDGVLAAPWSAAAIMAFFFLALGHWILPSIAHGNPILGPVFQGVKPLFSWVAAVFALVAAIKALLCVLKGSVSKSESTGRNEPRRPYKEDFHRVQPMQRPLRLVRNEPAVTRGPSHYAPKPGSWSLELLQLIEWKRFEDLCQKFYETKGIRSACTPLGPDGGIDIRLYQDDSGKATAIVQCKAWGESFVGVKPIRELLGVMVHEKVEKAFFMTTGKYSDEAKAFAEPNRITLIDGVMFLAMINRLPDDKRQQLLAFATAGNYNIPSCPTCGKKMRFVEGKNGKRDFWGCANFPKCRQKLGVRRGAGNLPSAIYQ